MILVDDGWLKIKSNAVLLEDHGNSALISAALNDRDRKFAASKKTGLLAIHGNQVRLRKLAQCARGLQRPDISRCPNAAIEKK